jgi:Skp family chaperone for outer membrane proteins
MKKLIMMALAVVAITFASCGNNTKSKANATDTASVDTAVAANNSQSDSTIKTLTAQLQGKDAKGIQATMTAVQAKYAELVKSGKLDKAYASKAKRSHFRDKAIQIASQTLHSLTLTLQR